MSTELTTTPGVVPTSGSRMAGVEGIRGLACLTILVVHVIVTLPAAGHEASGRLLQGTTLAMHSLTMFFVLSGFLLYLPFVRHVLAGRPKLSTKDYYVNRLLRIAPGYLVIFPICALVLGAVVIAPLGVGDSAHSVNQHFGRMTDPVDFLLNLTLLQGYVPSGVRTGLMVSWSLIPEVGFYIVLPLLALLGIRLARVMPGLVAMMIPPLLMVVVGRLTAMVVGARAAAAPESHREAMLYGDSWNAVLFNALPGVAHILGMGMGVAVLSVAARQGLLGQRVVSGLRGLGAFTVLLCAAAVVASPLVFGTFAGAIVCSAFLTWLMLPSAGRVHDVAQWFLETPPVQFLGLISYSLYLWHFPLIGFALLYLDFMVYDSLLTLLFAVVVTLAVAVSISWVTFRWVESPALRRKRTTRTTAA